MKSQQGTRARATRRAAFMSLATVLGLIGYFCLFTSTARGQNPVPFIQTMSPLSVSLTSAEEGFKLTVHGAGFVNGTSVIYWNGAALSGTTTTCTATQCSVAVPPGTVTAQGTAFVTVADPSQAGAVSNVVFLTIISPTPSVGFTGYTNPTGTQPKSVAVADFTGSGILDLAVANSSDNTVSILLGNGDGTFKTQTTFSSGYTPVAVAVGDFANSGHLSLAVVNACGTTSSGCSSSTTGTVSILLGDGTGSFSLKSTLTTGESPAAVAVGDFNGDGNVDVAVANDGDSTVSIFLGKGDGTFKSPTTISTGSGGFNGPVSLAVADFNGDGILDLAVANSGGDSVSILLGKGDGTTFTAATGSPVAVTGQYGPAGVAVGDFKNNGITDLAVVNACGTTSSGCSSSTTGTVTILLGKGDGTFTVASNTDVGEDPVALAVADLNSDGNLDVVTANQGDNTFSILLGDGTGNLTLQVSLPSPSPDSIAVGDFNRDGAMDVVTANLYGEDVIVLLAPWLTLACGTSQPTGTLCTVSPPSYTPKLGFGNTPEGIPVGPMTVTLTNTSNVLMGITSIAVTSGSSNFSIDGSTNCIIFPPMTSAGASCTIAVDFKPTGVGVFQGTVEIDDNARGTPQTINLTGAGTTWFKPTSLAFGSVVLPGPSAAETVTLTNNSSQTLNITSIAATHPPFTAEPSGTLGSTCGTSLGAGSSCIIAVVFAPTTAGSQLGTLSVTSTPSLIQTVSLSGTGVTPVTGVSPGSLSFPNQVYGSTSVAQPVTVSNTNAGTLTIASITKGGTNPSEFAQTNDCGTLPAPIPAFGNCTIYVTFTPSVTGPGQTATLSIAYENGGATQTVYLNGTAIQANTSAMITSNTPNPSYVGQPVTVNFTVTASPPGSGTPTGSVTVSDGTGDNCVGSLSGGSGHCFLTATTPGPKALTASYSGDPDFNTSVSAAVSQTVLKSNCTVSITPPSPSLLVVGQPVSVTVTVTANSPGSGTPTGKVKVSDTAGDSCVATLFSGTGSCVLTPSAPGSQTLSATYFGDSNFTFSTGSLPSALAVVDFSISITPERASLKPGTTTNFTLTLVPLGGFSGTVALTCSDPHLYTTCTLSSNSVLLTTTQLVKVQVYSDQSPIMPGTTVLTLTGKYKSGSPTTPPAGLTHSAEALINMPQTY